MIPHNSVFAPILTPFDDSGANIDTAAFTQHLQYLTNAGLDGVLVLGTNGEFAHLRDTEKSELVDLALQIEELQVIAGGTVPDSIEGTLALCSALNKHGSRLAGILVAPPFYGEYKSGHKISEKTVMERLVDSFYPVTPIISRMLRGEEIIVSQEIYRVINC